MKKKDARVLLLFIVLVIFAGGCLSWEPGWKMAQAPAAGGDVKALLEKATKLVKEADSKEKVQEIIGVYEEALKADPGNVKALNELGMYYFLQGYCYIEGGAGKKPYYIKAVQYNERAMYANPGFKALVDKGEPVWDACRVLGRDEMFAMYHWYLALGNYWADCFGTMDRLFNFYWPGRDMKVLERMTAVDKDWYAGSVHFCWAAYYTIAPGMLGGDMKKAAEYYDRAIAAGPNMTNFYIVRALYYHTKRNDRKAFVDDLNRALTIDPRKADKLEYPWAIWYVGRAKRLLSDQDRYFR